MQRCPIYSTGTCAKSCRRTLVYCAIRSRARAREPAQAASSLRLIVRMLRVMLAQQVLAIVVAVGRTHHSVNVIARRDVGFCKRDRPLVIELDEKHRAVYPVIEDAVGVG